MTVLDATNKLIDFFAQNEHFELEEDFKKVVLVSDSEADKAAVLLALEDMAKNGIVTKKDIGGHEYWILVKSLVMQPVQLSISLLTAANIANFINRYINNEKEKCNPLDLSERDIINLMLVAQR